MSCVLEIIEGSGFITIACACALEIVEGSGFIMIEQIVWSSAYGGIIVFGLQAIDEP